MPWGDNTKGQGPWGNKPTPPDDQPDFDEIFRNAKNKFDNMFGGGDNKKSILLALLVGAILWLGSGIYKVDTSEQGVVLRFGAFHKTTKEGLNYHLPRPIERVIIVPVTTVNEVEIGTRSSARSKRSVRITKESLMLTGDENIVDIDFTLQWRVNNAKDFLFNVKGQSDTVKSVAESAIREVVGRRPIDDALTDGRSEIEKVTIGIIQETLDAYGAGVEIIRLQIGEAQVPPPVIDAFRDVQAARADMERAKNEAEAYSNDIIPRARGEAEKVLQEAKAYKEQIVAKAEGEAQRFISVYGQYKKAKDITKKRIYLETMEEVLKGAEKMIIDNGAKGNGVVPFLPLNDIRGKK